MSELIWSEKEGVVTLPAVVTLETLPKIKGLKAILQYPVVTVDFNNVKQLDSSALALLLTWSGNVQGTIKVKNPPAELLTLIGLYDLESVLDVA